MALRITLTSATVKDLLTAALQASQAGDHPAVRPYLALVRYATLRSVAGDRRRTEGGVAHEGQVAANGGVVAGLTGLEGGGEQILDRGGRQGYSKKPSERPPG